MERRRSKNTFINDQVLLSNFAGFRERHVIVRKRERMPLEIIEILRSGTMKGKFESEQLVSEDASASVI